MSIELNPECMAAVLEEQQLQVDLMAAQVKEQECQATLAQCVTVVAALHDAIALTAQEKLYFDHVRMEPRRYGIGRAQASRIYYAKGKELRTLRGQYKAAQAQVTKARKAVAISQAEQKRISRLLAANARQQEALGLIAQRSKRTAQDLVDIAACSGLLDGRR